MRASHREHDKFDVARKIVLSPSEVEVSRLVRGDNTLENAKYLGYLIGEELYPDLRTTDHGYFIQEALAGKARVPIVFQRGRKG